MAKIAWGKILAGVAAATVAGAAYVYLKDRSARTAVYEALLSEGAFEIRQYPELLAIETVQHGSRDRALGNGFGLLADYMFGETRGGDEIPMTAPVLALASKEGGWIVRFLLPEDMTGDRLPDLPHGVSSITLPSRRVAAVKFSGKPDDRLFAAREAELRRWISSRDRNVVGPAEHAYYNSPLRPGPMRQNEILIPLA
ncbi:SOUL heme-binding protein [Sphingomonas sp. YR710]|jgi:hypothetical protein|uniref:SOUL family heme-binding protein n=1 Tax=Sphingomonas sp. YR710 TaxID=1882773 RepID=UPI0008828588|nr:heme-binding protein [Sphingomonas sp. YR710]SDD68384.1 SOUL heme-binding protein [Sphingomonas sp. YR710]